MRKPIAGTQPSDPFACTSFDAALCIAAMVISGRYVLALAQLGQEVMWGVHSDTVFWIGLLAAPMAALAPAWLLGRFTAVNPIWPAIGLATPTAIWAIGLTAEPLAMLLIGAVTIASACLTLIPAWHGRRLRVRSILRRQLCPGCGYSLKGLAAGVCPECGLRV